MKIHLPWIEHFIVGLNNSDQAIFTELIRKGFRYLVHLSELPGQVFRIMVDFWNDFSNHLLKKSK